jgi:hypothetical protein
LRDSAKGLDFHFIVHDMGFMIRVDHPLQILTVSCALSPSVDDCAALLATSQAFAAACRFVVSETPDELRNETKIRVATYRPIREKFGLSSNLAQQTISRVVAMRKSAKSNDGGTVDTFKDGSVQFDERTFQLFGLASDGQTASLTLLGGRRRIPLALSARQRAQLSRHVGAWNDKSSAASASDLRRCCRSGIAAASAEC